ncbi:hypothetical protein [Vibrio diabolicus]|uniref:hypothetical protein n=1 Tax=Vibrio diabolicus TaxID=50719 RepID=UPI0022A9A653|nr:hypothetical protein [Vibrio diabolicus]MCZ2368180.1 hypothetical protein [Vibrio diabolicus]
MNTELKQANEVLAEAREVLKKSQENLNKSLKANDLALVQHRKLAYALSCLVHPFNTMKPLSDDEIEQLQQSLKNIPSLPLEFVPKEPVFASGQMIGFVDSSYERLEQREVYDIVNAINVLAMANADVIHIFTRYQGHVDRFFISVEKVETDYSNTNRQSLFNDDVSLKDESSLEELLSIESQLTELIIEAREQAEAKAEVEV